MSDITSNPANSYWSQPPLQDRVAIVSGAARGIGLAIARTMAEAGARVVICDLDAAALELSANGLRSKGLDVQGVPGDVSVSTDVDRIVKFTVDTHGQIDVLVNNAGGSGFTPGRIEDVAEFDYSRVMDWNVRSTFLFCKAALPALKASKGVIVNVASMSGQIGLTMFSPQYSAAKAAVIGLTRNLAKHFGPFGIRVNAIAPGFISSGPRFDSIWQASDQESVLQDIPLRRIGETSELADVALFLSSDQSRYVSGVIINVDGGQLSS